MSTPISVAVGTSNVTVVPANPSRKQLVLTNPGNYPVDLMYATPPGGPAQTTAIVGSGIRLNPHGATYKTTSKGAFFGIGQYSAGTIITGFDL